MHATRKRWLVVASVLAGMALPQTWARDLKITLPRHSEMTLVQRLNREGVDAVRKQHYEKAEALFLKAYLYDPSDPFTLNNLGYIAELQGQLQRALHFYQLASQQGSEAAIDRSNTKQLEGRPMEAALGGLNGSPMQVNHMNVQAITLLADNRGTEANRVLGKALTIDPKNAFTLNNMGVAEESLGNYDDALRYFHEAANTGSNEPVVVTMTRSWRGKPVTDLAAESAKRLEKKLKDASSPEAQAALLSVKGVSATNRNDWAEARQDFLKAYSLNPQSAFTLNNLGYVSERDGDLETAHFFYNKALRADGINDRVGLATQSDAEGKHVGAVATSSATLTNGELSQLSASRHSEQGDVELIHRDGTPVDTTPEPKPAAPGNPSSTDPDSMQLEQRDSGQPGSQPPSTTVPQTSQHPN